ncbi:MAG: polysaccharide biosynthesis protein, partial [Chitinophagaceae bacterium]|nr:polysaccharide biosynthesis protein [Chitinophagaceae bacterium]
LHQGLTYVWANRWFNLGTATALLLFFTWFVMQIEKKELVRLPVVGKFIK